MKYFTSDWWQNGGEESSTLFQKYEDYFASIQSKLPIALVEFHRNHNLHDAEVKSIICNFQNRTVEINLNGWDQEFEFPTRYTLKFSDVSHFEQLLPPEENVDCELGDLGYWECETLDTTIEVRMLFASSAQFRIIFTDFNFNHEQYSS